VVEKNSLVFNVISGLIARMRILNRISISRVVLVLMACDSLGACADTRSAISGPVADNVPTWLGGMPKDVPPRRGTPEYESWSKKRAEEADAIKTGGPAAAR
jgi:hypothetical protein